MSIEDKTIAAYEDRLQASERDRNNLLIAIQEHYDQHADDRCIDDDDKLYAAAGLPVPCPNRKVGDKAAMLESCKRFIDNRCEDGGPWVSYAELEREAEVLRHIANSIPGFSMHYLEGCVMEWRKEFCK